MQTELELLKNFIEWKIRFIIGFYVKEDFIDF